jgi:2-methylcitrate dehydratase PrpD
MPQETQMLLSKLANYGAQAAQADLPDIALHGAKRALLDWLSALYPGTQIDPCSQLLGAHREELGVGRSSLPGNGTTAFPATAAWINGSVSHAVEFDDIFRDAAYHPGCPTIAAALAVAEHLDSDGVALLKAIVVGYEISTRIGVAVQPSHYRYFHTTGTVGCFGAAAAAAALCAPGDAMVMQHALATAATFASGLQQAFRSDAMTKALHAGNAASVGVRAAQAAAHGLTGVADILEGRVGFGNALATNPDWNKALDGLGERYNIAQVTIKNHGCCGHTFAAADAVIALREQGVTADNTSAINVATYQAALDITGNFQPRTPFEAKFSLAYVVAHALIYGSVRIEAFSAERLADPAIRKLMQRIKLTADPVFTAGFPGMRAARVSIDTNDGKHYEHFSPYRKGDPEAPLTDDELNAKFIELATPVIGKARVAALSNAVWTLERMKVRDLKLASDKKSTVHYSLGQAA